jgi:hypothetical protein
MLYKQKKGEISLTLYLCAILLMLLDQLLKKTNTEGSQAISQDLTEVTVDDELLRITSHDTTDRLEVERVVHNWRKLHRNVWRVDISTFKD